jgi:TolB-like protein/Tfp pilus assembly protein PilF
MMLLRDALTLHDTNLESGSPFLTEPSRAVFLSYASQDADAARRICDALRAAGIEVWFDKSELRGGDAWDTSIRKQIKTCALFLPVISHTTHDRVEGYFRLEWKLAVDRSHLIAAGRPFLLPVVIDDTRDDDELVPERFREVQWTRLPGGETPPSFVERIQRLLSGEMAPTQERAHSTGNTIASSAPAGRGLVRRRPGALYGIVAAALVLLVLGYLGFERLNGAKPHVPNAASIAVLPLANESGEASQQYFSDGISEDLITALGQFPGLKVIGRSSSFKFRDSKEDSRSIGAKLGVAHVLEGTVRKSGDVIRVSAQLIDTADGSMQWSERYDRAYKDLFALQDEITRAVAQALKTQLLPAEHASEQGERPPSGNLEAYNAMLQGRFYVQRNAEADMRKAIEFLARATEIDPRYAFAWSGLSSAWTSLGGGGPAGAAAQEAYAKAREASDRALALAPDLAIAHVARGRLLLTADFDWHGAQVEYSRGLALAPNDGSVKASLAVLLAAFGEVDQAIELTRQSLATDPLRAGKNGFLASYFLGLNRLDEAERAIRRALELQPNGESFYQLLTIIEIQRGNAQAALVAAQQEHPGPWQDSALALARQIGTDRSAADAALKILTGKWADGAPFQIAQVYALRNDVKGTFEWLDRAWESRDPGIETLLYDPFILRYKSDPRFAAFCHKVGLPAPGEAAEHKPT